MPDPSAAAPITRVARCPCGSLTVTVTGDPVNVHACTCTKCQRETGSVLGFNVWFAEDGVTVSGTYKTWHPNGEGAASAFSAFCPTCGGGGFFRSGSFLPRTIGLRAGHFGDSSFPAPHTVFWWGNRPHWLSAPIGPAVNETQ